MPRKPMDYEPIVLRVEGLSGGEAHTAQSPMGIPQSDTFMDDFTGLPIPLAIPEAEPLRPLMPIAPDHRELKRKGEARTRDEQLSMLVRLGLVDGPDPIPPEPPKPKPPHLAHNQRLIGGKVWTFTNPNAMKRRT